jgi:phosphatidylserine/phosphatidylglycerophosphate/cardiolipin synthase-like enzyme
MRLVVLFFVVAAAFAATKKLNSSAKPTAEIDLSQVAAPVDDEVCFSPEGHCDLKLLKFIQSAQKSIDVAVYDINLDALVHELLAKSKKGVSVRLVVDKRQASEKNSLVATLIKAGGDLKYGHQRGIMHNKFVIVDGHRLETGSFNYTNHASVANNENQIYLSTPAVVERFQKRFADLWEEGTAATSVRTPASASAKTSGAARAADAGDML